VEVGFLTFSFTGINGAGTIPVPGLKAGDRVLWSTWLRKGSLNYAAPGSFVDFEARADGEIAQIDASDNSAATIEILVFRGG